MKLSDFSIGRPLATIMIIAAMIFIGIVSLSGLPIDLFPEIDFPVVTITVPYPGAAPGEVETGITKTVEEAVSSLEGVKKITATSREGMSLVMIEFEWGVDLDIKANDVREKVSSIEAAFPEDAEDAGQLLRQADGRMYAAKAARSRPR